MYERERLQLFAADLWGTHLRMPWPRRGMCHHCGTPTAGGSAAGGRKAALQSQLKPRPAVNFRRGQAPCTDWCHQLCMAFR
eukprot:365842-Chlamydomonas_euryale.AAC.5